MGINFTRVTKNPSQEKDALVFDTTLLRRYTVLAINPGSTSTKIAVYNGDEVLVEGFENGAAWFVGVRAVAKATLF